MASDVGLGDLNVANVANENGNASRRERANEWE